MRGRRFFKMTGSGNDFLMFDVRSGGAGELGDPTTIRALCARGTGVGADGIVLLESADDADFRMIYYNSDGSRASMCGNGALCVTALAARLGAGNPHGMRFQSDAGPVSARLRDGAPEVELAAVEDIRPDAGIERAAGERRIGFALAGVPHLVVRRETLELDVDARGRELRHHASVAPAGANVNFVAPDPSGIWEIRTYERGVEGETLACGTGAVATAVLLNAWSESGAETRLRTRAGRDLVVRLNRSGTGWLPSLSGEGRLVFVGELPGVGED